LSFDRAIYFKEYMMRFSVFASLGFVSWMLLGAPLAYAQKGMDQLNINGQFVMAGRIGQVERVKALLAEGAKVDSRDRNGDSPLNMAATKGNVALADALLAAGADVNLANIAGVTPLMGAAFSGNVQIVRKLLAAGAKIEPVDRVKKNAATYAAGNGCAECLTELLRAGTQVNAPLENDLTLLMWAAAYGGESSVRLLLAQGADRSLKDKRGKTAADMAIEGNHLGVVALLKQP
jgi:uncharacterized protein